MTIQEYKKGQEEALSSSSTVKVGIGGFTTFAVVSDSSEYSTQAPTSVVEDGSYIGDHLINAPLALTINGDVADVFIAEAPVSRSDARVPTVGIVNSFKPGRTASQIQRVSKIVDTARERYDQLNDLLSIGSKSGTTVSDVAGNQASAKSITEKFIDFIESVHYGKQLISISMPFRLHESMAVTSVTVSRDNQRNALTFSLTAQKFRIAKTILTNASNFYKKPAPSVKSQTAGTSDKGTQSPKSGDGNGEKKQKSVLTAILGR